MSHSGYWVSSFGRDSLTPVSGICSSRRVDLIIAAARRRWPGGRVYRRKDGGFSYMSSHGRVVGRGLLCQVLVQPAFCGVGPDSVCWFVESGDRKFAVRRF